MKLGPASFLRLFATGAIVLSSPAFAQQDGLQPETFTVTDERAPEEISEISRLYLNGHLAATFRLTLAHSRETVTLPLPTGLTEVTYALCGEITILRNGRQETHEVSSEGVLHHPEGHSLDAVASAQFTEFFLVDYDDYSVADHRRGRAAVCAAPSS